MIKGFQIVTAIAILFGVVGLLSLCFGSFADMKTGEMGSMANCALAHATTLCPVSVTQNLQFWQQVVVTTSPTTVLLALMVAVVAFSLKQLIDPLHAAAARLQYRLWQLLSEPALLLGDYLRQAFSQGILHPKIY